MVLMPGPTPVTIPADGSMVATDVVPLIQVPPPASVKLMVEATHTAPGMVIVPGNGLTVTIIVAVQLAADV